MQFIYISLYISCTNINELRNKIFFTFFFPLLKKNQKTEKVQHISAFIERNLMDLSMVPLELRQQYYLQI